MKRVVAQISHLVPERASIRLAVGDEVLVGERDTEWPEFVFVTAAPGSGWVPARNLSADHGRAVVREPYDTTELPTDVGETLEVIAEDRLGGWLWCRSAAGAEGWVPIRTVESEPEGPPPDQPESVAQAPGSSAEGQPEPAA